MKIGEYTTHPVADLYPLMRGPDFQALVADIRERGQSEPILLVVLESGELVVDGRNRLRACIEAGLAPRFAYYDGPTDLESLLAFSLSRNCARRHLSHAQRCLVAGRSYEIYERAAKERMLAAQNNDRGRAARDNCPEQLGRAREHAAKAHGISERGVREALLVLRQGVESLIDAVEADIVSISGAAEVAALPRATQEQAVSMIADGPRKVRQVLRHLRDGGESNRAAGRSPERLPGAPPPEIAAAYSALQVALDEATDQFAAARRTLREALERLLESTSPGTRTKVERHLTGHEVYLNAIAKHAREMVAFYRPVTICPSCDGEGCAECRDVGWHNALYAGTTAHEVESVLRH